MELSARSKELIAKYSLEAHPEGCFFTRTFCSELTCKNIDDQTRFIASSIYFLLPQGHKSHLHRLKSDEMWHFYEGSSLTVVQISPQGELQKVKIGSNHLNGEKLQHLVPAGYWFGAYSNGEYSFVGCTVSPAFDYADFELAKRSELIQKYPHASAEITLLTHD